MSLTHYVRLSSKGYFSSSHKVTRLLSSTCFCSPYILIMDVLIRNLLILFEGLRMHLPPAGLYWQFLCPTVHFYHHPALSIISSYKAWRLSVSISCWWEGDMICSLEYDSSFNIIGYLFCYCLVKIYQFCNTHIYIALLLICWCVGVCAYVYLMSSSVCVL